jgi:hypothetical protein
MATFERETNDMGTDPDPTTLNGKIDRCRPTHVQRALEPGAEFG